MSLETEASDQLLMALEDDELRFNSTTLKELSEALQDDSINLIGLHGGRGSGKTTLVGLVRDKVKSLKMFYAVLFVSMSKIQNPWKIRDLIAEQQNQEFGGAKKLKSTVGRMDQILVILDDVPAKFDPKKYMGISCNDPQCKFLLTTRSNQDCILLMGEREVPCQKMIPMGPLSSEDTWRLLQKHSGIEDDKSDLSNVANEIAFKYEWFPGSTIEIGSFLKDRPSQEWKGILDGLRKASASYDIFLSFRGMDTNRFTSALCDELKKNGLIKIFKNDTKLGAGDSTSPEHVKAIEDSILSIVVLSENYVGSAKCLDELVHILKCKKTKNQLVWPIYYRVESMFIMHQQYPPGAKLLEEKIKKDPTKIKKWKSALLEVSQLASQFASAGLADHTFIKKYVEEVKKAEIFLYKQIKDMEWSKADCEFELFFTQGRLLIALEENELRFNSTTLKELSRDLQDDSIYIIGLYGQQGSGKTTLVEAVRDKAKSLKIFDVVLFATVSQNPNIRSIQEQIASLLNLTFDKENKLRRAMKIESTLESIERILVILDDVPAEFDPEYIGIPCKDQQCKFLLTTRNRQDCTLMISQKVTYCQKMIPMRHLSEEDAWKLLQKHSGIEDEDDESSSNLLTVAKEIAFKYKWLPGTIKKIGSSFRGDLEKWKGLLASLRHASARYQIFLSFRGRDTRTNFTSSLNDELKKNGFKTFMDNDQLRTGDSISTELIQAIEDSRLSIAILSENYPESSWCLEELVHILQCKESKKQLVWPIFYEVEPRDIGRHQTKDGENTMAKLEKKFKDDPDKINKWKSALAQVSKISGRNYNEAAVGFSQPKFIREIINSAKEYRNNYLYIRNMDMD